MARDGLSRHSPPATRPLRPLEIERLGIDFGPQPAIVGIAPRDPVRKTERVAGNRSSTGDRKGRRSAGRSGSRRPRAGEPAGRKPDGPSERSRSEKRGAGDRRRATAKAGAGGGARVSERKGHSGLPFALNPLRGRFRTCPCFVAHGCTEWYSIEGAPDQNGGVMPPRPGSRPALLQRP